MKPALEVIWKEFSTQLDRFIRVRVSDHAAAEDILQDVFFKLQSRLEEFRDPTRLRAWLMLVARNAIIDYYRTRKPTAELTDSLADPLSRDGIEEQELKTVFHRLLLSLPEQYREA